MSKGATIAAWLVVATFVASAWAGEAIVDCLPKGNARPVCGFHNPEDLALLPSGRFLVVSQMGLAGDFTPGTLVIALEKSFLNDVATLPGGGFVATHMFPHGSDTAPACVRCSDSTQVTFSNGNPAVRCAKSTAAIRSCPTESRYRPTPSIYTSRNT